MAKTYTIQDLREGKVALHNDEDSAESLVKLKKVLQEAFPEDDSPIIGTSEYYFLWTGSEHLWQCNSKIDENIPAQKLDLFIEDTLVQRFPFTIDTKDCALLLEVFDNFGGWDKEILNAWGKSLIKTGQAEVEKQGYDLLRRVSKDDKEKHDALDSIFGADMPFEWIPGAVYKVIVAYGKEVERTASETPYAFYMIGDTGLLFSVNESQIVELVRKPAKA